MKTILIAGGSGFVGSNLCKKLISDENKIIVIDNLITGNSKNIKPFLEKKNFYFVNQDPTSFSV